MTSEQARSEQQEQLELESEPPVDEPRRWRERDPDRAGDAAGIPTGGQLSAPDGGGTPVDREPTEIADYAGTGTEVGPEQQAVRVEPGEERDGVEPE